MKKNLLIKSITKNIQGFKFNNKNDHVKKMEKTPYYTSRKIILDIINKIILKKTAQSKKKILEKDLSLFLNKFSKNLLTFEMKLPEKKKINEDCFKMEKEPTINKMDNWNRGQINKFSFKITKKKNINDRFKSFSYKRKESIQTSLSRNYISNSNNSLIRKNLKKKKIETALLVDFSKINIKKINKYENKKREEKLGLKKLDKTFQKRVK